MMLSVVSDPKAVSDAPPLLSFFKENAVWWLGLVPVALAAIRVLVVSGGNPELLKALVVGLDVTDLVLATLLPVLPVILFWVWIWWIFTPYAHRYGPEEPDWHHYLSIAPMVLVVAVLPLDGLLINIGVLAVLFVFRYFRNRGRGKRSVPARVDLSGWVVLIGLNAIVYANSMWLPSENIDVDTQKPVKAYVLSSDVRWTTYLVEDGPIRTVASASVKDREVCADPLEWHDEPLWSFLDAETREDQPRCV